MLLKRWVIYNYGKILGIQRDFTNIDMQINYDEILNFQDSMVASWSEDSEVELLPDTKYYICYHKHSKFSSD